MPEEIENTNTTPLNLEEEPKVVYIDREQRPGLLSGFNRVLEILANKISKKAALIALAMVLIYLLAVTPSTASLLAITGVISILALIGVILQFTIDYQNAKKREEQQRKIPPPE